MFKKFSPAPVDTEILRPCGVKDCLKNLTFVRTGELKSMNSDQLKLYIQTYSGKCTEAVSGKTNYLIKAENPGAKKTQEAEKRGVQIISEDEFFKLVVQLSSKLNSDYKNSDHIGNYEFSLKPFGQNSAKQDSIDQNKAEEQLLHFQFPQLVCKEDMISNQNVYVSLLEHLVSDKYKYTCLFVYGPSGCGKSALVKCLCQQNNIQLIYLDPSMGVQEFREQMKVFYTPQYNLQNKKAILAIDNPEQCPAACYKHLLNVLTNNKKVPTSQMVLISADWHNQKSQTLMKYCECFQLKRASKSLICRYLTNEFMKQTKSKDISEGFFDILSNKCNGDIRMLQHLLLMPIYNNLHNVNQYASCYLNEDHPKIVDHVFKFQHYIRENPSGVMSLTDAFYQNTALVYASIIQNFHKYLNHDINYLADISQTLSSADLVAYRMMQIGDWQGSRSCATLSLIVPGIQSTGITPIGFIMPTFPSVIYLKQQQGKQQANSYYIMDNTFQDLGSQHDFFEKALEILESMELDNPDELLSDLYINPEILNTEIHLSKHLKALIKNNTMDDIKEPGTKAKNSPKVKKSKAK